MPAPSTLEGIDLRCSSYSRALGVDPIGTASPVTGFLLVEWPLPWPGDLAEIEALAPVAAACSAAGLRLQALVARGDSDSRAVVCYRTEPRGETGGEAAGFAGYTRYELAVDPHDVVAAACSLAAGEAPSPSEPRDDAVRDVLVCTHGRRDRCCGSLGTALAVNGVASGLGSAGSVRLWRTSHTGGHRFAPTAIVLPEGTMWGYLDDERLAAVLSRTDPARDWLDGYRGCAGLGSRELQVLERAALAELGWEVLEARRSGSVGPASEPAGGAGAWTRARLEINWPDGRRAAYAGEVGVAREVPIPQCGEPVELSAKLERELGLRGLARLS